MLLAFEHSCDQKQEERDRGAGCFRSFTGPARSTADCAALSMITIIIFFWSIPDSNFLLHSCRLLDNFSCRHSITKSTFAFREFNFFHDMVPCPFFVFDLSLLSLYLSLAPFVVFVSFNTSLFCISCSLPYRPFHLLAFMISSISSLATFSPCSSIL